MAKGGNLKCPSCGKKLSTSKHYDPTFEWFECPKCEGCFTYDEILEGGGAATEEANGDVDKTTKKKVAKKKIPLAKGKKKKAKEEEEKPPPPPKPYGVPTREIVNVIADEIEAIYTETGRTLDRVNAYDKGLSIMRAMVMEGKVKFKETEIPMKLCKDHSG